MAYRSANAAVQAELDRLSELATPDVLAEMKGAGVEIDEMMFRKIGNKHHSITAIAKRWNAPHTTSQSLLFAATTVLWDRLCSDLFLWEAFAGEMSRGIELIQQGQRREAVSSWLSAWERLQAHAVDTGIRDISVLDVQVPQNMLKEDLFSWVQDVEMELTNQVDEDADVADTLLHYTESFMETFPKSATPILLNMKSAKAIALFVLGRADEADAIYESITKEYAEDAWTFIDWGDEYSPQYRRNPSLVNPEKAKSIYERGLETATQDEDILRERLALLS
ncbi:hypothetical protein [Alicyclobacillus dauci]|uniref:Uncharacterized protein n=1 Tax=Alicyclobacillus dauci TaxID=1475485 RepID=A0ABY6Z7D1_9BACL|nr:hypothetical protein [Alicyclobacillus dauci]WAH38081.1 hypothetical protein NZD86_06220 [Alicyclobacillus dauci]